MVPVIPMTKKWKEHGRTDEQKHAKTMNQLNHQSPVDRPKLANTFAEKFISSTRQAGEATVESNSFQLFQLAGDFGSAGFRISCHPNILIFYGWNL